MRNLAPTPNPMCDLPGLTLGSSKALSGRLLWGKLPSPFQIWHIASISRSCGGSCRQCLGPQPPELTCMSACKLAQAASIWWPPYWGLCLRHLSGTLAENCLEAVAEVFFSTLTQCFSTPSSFPLLCSECLCPFQIPMLKFCCPMQWS